MKAEKEIQRAHDLLTGVLLGDADVPMSDEARRGLYFAADVLCWVLEHDHNQQFSVNMSALEAKLARMGYGLIDSAQLQTRESSAQ